MQCKKCGAENNDWSEICTECGTYLKSVRFDGFTKVVLIISLIEAVYLAITTSLQFARYISATNLITKVALILTISALIAAAANIIYFMIKKKKRNLIAVCMLWGVYILCSLLRFRPPLFLVIASLPVLAGVCRVAAQWKKLD